MKAPSTRQPVQAQSESFRHSAMPRRARPWRAETLRYSSRILTKVITVSDIFWGVQWIFTLVDK